MYFRFDLLPFQHNNLFSCTFNVKLKILQHSRIRFLSNFIDYSMWVMFKSCVIIYVSYLLTSSNVYDDIQKCVAQCQPHLSFSFLIFFCVKCIKIRNPLSLLSNALIFPIFKCCRFREVECTAAPLCH